MTCVLGLYNVTHKTTKCFSWWLNGTKLGLKQEKKLGNHAFTCKQQVAYKNTKETNVNDAYMTNRCC